MLLDALRDVVMPLQAHVEALESQHPTWRDVIFFVLFAFAVGVMFGLAVWWFQ